MDDRFCFLVQPEHKDDAGWQNFQSLSYCEREFLSFSTRDRGRQESPKTKEAILVYNRPISRNKAKDLSIEKEALSWIKLLKIFEKSMSSQEYHTFFRILSWNWVNFSIGSIFYKTILLSFYLCPQIICSFPNQHPPDLQLW